MADAKISELAAAAAVTADDLLALVDDPGGTPASKKATVTQLATFLRSLSEELTNKTINGSSNTITNVSLTTGVTGTLPIGNGGTGASSLAAGLIQSNGTVLSSITTSAAVRSLISDETGAGAMVFADTPTLVTPNIGAATGTSLVASAQLAAGTYVSVGGTVASTGSVRLTDESTIYGISGGTNYRLLYFSSGQLNLGESGAGINALVCYGQSSISLAIGSATVVRVTSSGLQINDGGGQYYTFAPSNIAADRTITLPLLTGNDTLVTEAFAQTLTSKTINGSSNTITNVSLTTGVTGTLPVGNGGTGITSLGAGVATFLGTPSSANLAACVTGETGSAGGLVFSSSPTISSPTFSNTTTFTGRAVLNLSAMGALAIDWSLGNTFTKTLSAGGNTLTFSNATDGQTIIVILTSNAGGSTVTWPSGVRWTGGTEPTQTSTGTDVYTLTQAGSVIYGSYVQNFS
jgi:hypothetical protein